MKKDLKNVVLTFGLMTLVLTGGSFVYQKKAERQRILAAQQERLEKFKNDEVAKAERNRIVEQIRQDQLRKQQIAQEQAAIQNAKDQASLDKALAAQAQADSARREALALAQQKAQALAQQQAQARAQVAVTPSRRSRAS